MHFLKQFTENLKKIKTFVSSLNIFVYIFLISLYLLYPTFKNPGMYQAHDSEFHIIRAMHFKDELLSGQFPVRMAPKLAYGFGYDVFNFFYPLPYYTTVLFQLTGISTTLSWKLMQLLITVLSLLIFYKWMRKHFQTVPATIATVLFALVPFRILTIYVTNQIGGYFALLFVTLIGLSLHSLIYSKKQKPNFLLSLGIAGLVTSHLLSIIIFFFPLGAYSLYLLKEKYSREAIKNITISTVLGLGLSSFYLLPFLFEKSWVELGQKVLIDYTDHFVTLKQLIYSSWGYGTSVSGVEDTMTFQIGLSLLIVLGISILQLFKQKKKDSIAIILVSTLLFIILLMTEYSAFIWKLITPLQLIQYPWRLLAAIIVFGSFLAAWSIQQLKGKQQLFYVFILIFVAVYNTRNYIKPWHLDWKTDTDYVLSDAYLSSTDISWELKPIGATGRPFRFPGAIMNATPSGVIIKNITQPSFGSTKEIINISTTQEANLELSVWDLPVWEIEIDDQKVKKQTNDDGIIIIPVTHQTKEIKVNLIKTPLEKFSELISLISLAVIILLQKKFRT